MPAILRSGGHSATLARSVRLFRLFRLEQTDPDRYYTALAEDSVTQLSDFTELRDAIVLDVGSGSDYFAKAFDAAGARYASVEKDRRHANGERTRHIVGCATASRYVPDSVDVTYSSNVLEHVAEPWSMANEMVRVTRPGGLIVISFTLWWSAWGGHETSPWHLLGGEYAERRYCRRFGHLPHHQFGESMFPRTASSAMRWASSCPDADVVAAFPKISPLVVFWVARVPLFREIATWNLVVVLRKR